MIKYNRQDTDTIIQQGNHHDIYACTIHPATGLACSGTRHCSLFNPGYKKENRDTTGQFDGIWLAQVDKTPTPQSVQNWRFQCRDRTGNIYMNVANGEVTMVFAGKFEKTYISKAGKFNFTIPAGSTSASNSSDIGMDNPDVSFIIRGNLSKDSAKGTFVVGFAQVGYAGCTSNINYRRK